MSFENYLLIKVLYLGVVLLIGIVGYIILWIKYR